MQGYRGDINEILACILVIVLFAICGVDVWE